MYQLSLGSVYCMAHYTHTHARVCANTHTTHTHTHFSFALPFHCADLTLGTVFLCSLALTCSNYALNWREATMYHVQADIVTSYHSLTSIQYDKVFRSITAMCTSWSCVCDGMDTLKHGCWLQVATTVFRACKQAENIPSAIMSHSVQCI